MAQAQTPVQEPQFEVLDLGEGGLGLKLVRLKEMRNTGKISEAHFEWALKRLLRVRTFGCPGDHELVRADTSLTGWTCNVCTKAVPLGTTVFRRPLSKVLLPATLSSQDASVLTFSDIFFLAMAFLGCTVFSCRVCDWDGCKDCLNEAKHTAASEVKYDWWGDEEEEEEDCAPLVVQRVRFECANKHTLEQTRTTSDLYQCNLCAQRLPLKARVFSCRVCDFDGCGLCYARELAAQDAAAAAAAAAPTPDKSPAPETAVGVIACKLPEGAEPEEEITLRCPGGHLAREYCTPDADWACDLCGADQLCGGVHTHTHVHVHVHTHTHTYTHTNTHTQTHTHTHTHRFHAGQRDLQPKP
jgi:hypothetical protein